MCYSYAISEIPTLVISPMVCHGDFGRQRFWSCARVAKLFFPLSNEYLRTFCVKMNMGSHCTPSISPKSVVLLRFDMKDGYRSYTHSSIEKSDEKSEPATFDGKTVRYIYGWAQRKQRRYITCGTQFARLTHEKYTLST